jgi:hypothetical protein
MRFSPEDGVVTLLLGTCDDCVLIALLGFIGTIILLLFSFSPSSLYYSSAPIFHKRPLIQAYQNPRSEKAKKFPRLFLNIFI